MVDTRSLGRLGERIAASFLQAKGYRLVARNYRVLGREIDILARDGDCLVAVEVKLRRGDRFGRAVEAVDRRKLERIRFALQGLLAADEGDSEARIDLVVIDFSPDMSRMVIRHVEGSY